MNRDEMIQVLSTFCQLRPVTSCPSCPIRIRPANGMGCKKIKERTDVELAACVEKIQPEEQPVVVKQIETLQEPEQPRIRHMVTVDRGVLQTIVGKLTMLACCTGARISTEITAELDVMADQLQAEIEACDQELILAEKAMQDALQREREALEQKEKE